MKIRKSSKSNFFLSGYSKFVSENVFWITGPARSGTSLLGNILSTLKRTEYFYEPELMFTLLPLMKSIPLEKWKLIYETYLSEELYFNRLTGRKLNFRKKDISYIKNSLNNNQVKKLLSNELNRSSISKNFERNRTKLIIKVPDIIKNISGLTKVYTQNKLIFSNRNSADIALSLIKKNWFHNTTIKNSTFPLIKHKNEYIPTWVPKKNYKQWYSYNGYERCVFYVILTKKAMRKLNPNFIFEFEEITNSPMQILNKFCRKFKFKQTKKTLKIIKSIKSRKLIDTSDLKKFNIRSHLIQEMDKIKN